MLRKISTFICLIILTGVLSAAEFKATVESARVNFGDVITLNLSLHDAQAVDVADLAPLMQDFRVYSQQQYSSYSNTNGNARSENGWRIILMPKQPGQFTIPSIALNTTKGKLTSQPIEVTVVKGKATSASAGTELGVTLLSSVSHAKPYLKQPIIYTLKVISYKPITNVQLTNISSKDAIIERLGEPKQYTQSVRGIFAHVAEINFAITPLKEGRVEITAPIITGEMQVKATGVPSQNLGFWQNLMTDNFYELKPFSSQGEQITLDVQPPLLADNWLPLYDLKLTENWEGLNQAKAGDAITRKITITAKGTYGNQLPNLKEYMELANLKVYNNKPVINDLPDQNNLMVVGVKEEEFSLVPQQPGTYTLPEIKLHWWNIKTQKSEVTVLPSKTIEVLPNTAVTQAPDSLIDFSDDQPVVQHANDLEQQPKVMPANKWLYLLIGLLVLMLFGMFGYVLHLRNRKPTLSKPEKPKATHKAITTVIQLRTHIMDYAVAHWQTPKETTLNMLGVALTEQGYNFDLETYSALSEEINAAIYAKAEVNLRLLIECWDAFKATVKKSKDKTNTNSEVRYSSLNPT